MVFGTVPDERIQFNEDTLWTGKPHNYDRAGAGDYLPQIRQFVFEGKDKDAATIARAHFLSDPVRQKAYQPFGDIHLHFPGHDQPTNYRRQLDLSTAIAQTTYTSSGVTYQRQVFASYPDNVIVIQLTADQPGKLTFSVNIDSPHKKAQTQITSPNTLTMTGQVLDNVAPFEPGLRFESILKVLPTGGKTTSAGNSLSIENADSATLLLVAATSFKNFQDISADPAERCQTMIAHLDGQTFQTLLARHEADYQPLFGSVKLDLGQSDRAKLPTDHRLHFIVASASTGNTAKDAPAPDVLPATGLDADPSLAALFFQFGRYMLISSSRPGTQPANLQGVWNSLLSPPWESKYTTNINVEMNYWPAEVTNLSQCHLPLFDMIHDLTISGSRTAHDLYHSRGWVLHHNTDIWRGTAPINNIDGVWPTGGAWLCQHLWDHYLFTQDASFLADSAYPAMKGASLFFVDSLVKDPTTGYMVTNPSFSPEQGTLCAGPAMDMQLIRSLFDSTIQAAAILHTDADFAEQLIKLRSQLAPDKIGKYGQLQEWQQDVDKPNNNHRHMSPLWGIYPGSLFTRQNPTIFAAAKVLLQWRGDGSTGWSYAWRIPIAARVANPDLAYRQLSLQLAKRTFPDLFDKCGPFQVDGNFGATAGIAELLLQSHLHSATDPKIQRIDLLPALPRQWPTGSVTALCARGGFEVDMTWHDGHLTQTTIRSKLGNPCEVHYGSQMATLTTIVGKAYTLDGNLK
jgi:alpha-L-fucosidase 2